LTGGVEVRVITPRFPGEEWRIFKTGSDLPHLVLEKVETGPESGYLSLTGEDGWFA